ncbi:alginate export family protein [Hymenobacter terricola]|uniref:alginate export family protein n=1 Tax=Hymenobacter terricola TaxID=2819236 RepID=UPI001B3029E1|nr:alginate export family protein [Hymenobacter terricola]
MRFFLVFLGLARVGQSQPQPPRLAAPPPFLQLHAQEDYRYLAHDSTVRPSVVDPIKFIPLTAARTSFLTLGGEIREQYERLNHANWGEGVQDPNGYLLQRVMLHANAHFGRHFRLFGELKSGLAFGQRSTPRPSDEDKLDLHQAFADVAVGDDTHSLTLRLGRQEMAYGSSRLVAVSDPLNVRRTFDGGRLFWLTPQLKLDAFVTRPVNTKPGFFDDGGNRDVWFWGLYGVRPVPRLHGGLDVYYLGFHNQHARFQQGAAAERRHSVGARWWGAPSAFSYNIEAVEQFGRFGEGRIQAGTVAVEIGYAFRAAPLHPELTLRTDYISGDKNLENNDLQTFNPMFPKGAYFGQLAVIGLTNVRDIHPILVLHPPGLPQVVATVDWDFFWRARRTDGFYTVPYILKRPGTAAQSAYIGSQLTGEVEWDANRYLKFEVFLTYFQAGDYLKESGAGDNITYFAPRVTLRF